MEGTDGEVRTGSGNQGGQGRWRSQTSEQGTVAIAFAVEGENFAIAVKERMGAKLMIQLVAILGSKMKGKAKAVKTAPDADTAIVAEAVELFPEEDGGAVLAIEMDGIDIPIRLDAGHIAQLAQVIDAQKPVGLDVDQMVAKKPNALETDKRFFLQLTSGQNKIEWKFGRDKAEELHRTLGVWLSEFPTRKPH